MSLGHFVLLTMLIGAALVAAIVRRRPQPPTRTYDPPTHVKVTGEQRRCVRCRRVRVCHDLAEGWGPQSVTLPYCSPCVRDVLDVPHGQGEVHA